MRKVLNSRDHTDSVEERGALRRQKHEEAHSRHRRPGNYSGHRSPDEEVAGEALDCSGQEHHPRSTKPVRRRPIPSGYDGGVEEAGENPEIAAEVHEDGNGIESGLVIALTGLEHRRVDAEGVRAYAALDPYAHHCGYPFVAHHFHS